MDYGPYIIAGISSGVALASAALSLHGVRVAHRLEEEREARTKVQQLEQLMARYRDPVIRSAFDLQSRVYNILRQDQKGFLEKYYSQGTPTEIEYARESTLHVIGEYLGWVEIFRRDIQFLDLHDLARNRELAQKLEAVSQAFYDDRLDPVFRVFRGEQRAIGEVMIVASPPGAPAPRECMGYATFVNRRKDQELSRWFTKLEGDIDLLAAERDRHHERLIRLQHALIDLVDFLDPDRWHFPSEIRAKLEPPAPVSGDAASGSTAGAGGAES